MEIKDFLKKTVAGEISLDDQLEFLQRYTPDKLKPKELKQFVDFMFENLSEELDLPAAIDVCGTGGSGLPRINTSTVSAFILAELGVGVAKHGNRAASGRFGSFDLLESLGVNIEKDGGKIENDYIKTNLAFIYARKFHPVMKHFAEARQKFGKASVFNILGPLLNPAKVKKQIIGTSFEDQMSLIAETCQLLGKERVMVVRGEDGLDEVTLTGKTKVVELCDGKIKEYEIGPEDFGIESCTFAEISGGDRQINTKIATKILKAQKTSGRHRDLVLVNTALALKLAGKFDDLKEGYRQAKSVIGGRKLAQTTEDILLEISMSKLLTPSVRDFKKAISADGIAVIAEVKKASPSEGQIFNGEFIPEKIAKEYINAGAKAISVLTDENYFQGSFENLSRVNAISSNTPLLCKDFILYEYQIFKARENGADAILLIAALLSVENMKQFIELSKGLEMDCLVEVHSEEELEKALDAEAEIIGINNRNLKDFSVDLETSNRLVARIPKDKVIVSESGIRGREDVEKLDKRVQAVLIGSSLMKARNIKEKLNEFL